MKGPGFSRFELIADYLAASPGVGTIADACGWGFWFVVKTACKVYLIGKDTDLGYFEIGPTLRTSEGNTNEAVISQTPRGAWKRDS